MNQISGISSQKLTPQINANNAAQSSKQFAYMLENALNQVNQTKIQSDQSAQNLINGNAGYLHNVMINAEKAQITLTAAVEIRNKVINAYQSVMKMQI